MRIPPIRLFTLSMGSLFLALGAATPLWAGKKAQETVNVDPNSAGPVRGVGIEGQDIARVADQMMRDILANPALAGQNPQLPPQILIDPDQVTNESSQRINKAMIVARLRNELNRASQGRFVFVDRAHMQRILQERDLKRSGTVDMGTTGLTRATAGVDYQLTGALYSTESQDVKSGMVQRTTDINFELLDMERGTIIWSNTYTITRASGKDIVYR